MKRHALIVDDNEVDIMKISKLLEKDGIIPVSATNAREAIAMTLNYRLDFALIDVNMPKVNGYKLIQELKSSEQASQIPIIMMSGSNRAADDIRQALHVGAIDFLVKPIDAQVLTAKVERILTNSSGWGEWSLEGSKIDSKGLLQIEVEVMTISEMGVRLHSSVPMALKSSPKVMLPLFDELEIAAPCLQVLECAPMDKGFSVYISFVGMSEAQLKKIRLLCIKLGALQTGLAKF